MNKGVVGIVMYFEGRDSRIGVELSGNVVCTCRMTPSSLA